VFHVSNAFHGNYSFYDCASALYKYAFDLLWLYLHLFFSNQGK
jgi:hypothetical protein